MKKKHTVVKSNHLITAAYQLTIAEQRIISICISKIDSKGQLLPTDKFEVTADEISDLVGSDHENHYRDMKIAIDRLFKRSIRLNDKGGEARWIYEKDYGEGKATIYFSPTVIPYLSQLTSHFTCYELKNIGKFKNRYSLRVYELLCQWLSTGKREVEINEFRKMLELTSVYQEFKEFNRNVITPVLKDITENSNIWCEISFKKREKKITHIVFNFGEKAAQEPSKPKSKTPRPVPEKRYSGIKKSELDKLAKPGEKYEEAGARIAKLRAAVGQ